MSGCVDVCLLHVAKLRVCAGVLIGCVCVCVCVQAMQEMNGKELGGEEIEIVLAKPPDKKRKERQAARQTSRNTG